MRKKSVGELLRKEREELHLSVEDIARRTFIRNTYLAAIEDGRYDLMPDAVITRGFVRNYAETMGLDGDIYVQRLNQEMSLSLPMIGYREESKIKAIGKSFRKNVRVVDMAPSVGQRALTLAEKVILFAGMLLVCGIFAWAVY